jgi:flagellar biosynthesis/type III secretory pathway chaperone
MATDNVEDLISELDALLDRERRALTGGELDQLADLIMRKETIIGRLGGLILSDPVRLDPLRDKMIRNRMLLDSALEGIRAVAGRMAELRRVRKGLETYDRAGQRSHVDTALRPNVERRA